MEGHPFDADVLHHVETYLVDRIRWDQDNISRVDRRLVDQLAYVAFSLLELEAPASLPLPETMDTYMIGDRSLADWHQWLTTEDGEDVGHFGTGGSRYGATASQCAYWAIAGEVVYVHSVGLPDDIQSSLDHAMGLAVNDSDAVGEMVRDNLWLIPNDLAEKLDWERFEWKG
jgi:hypothetical protein